MCAQLNRVQPAGPRRLSRYAIVTASAAETRRGSVKRSGIERGRADGAKRHFLVL